LKLHIPPFGPCQSVGPQTAISSRSSALSQLLNCAHLDGMAQDDNVDENDQERDGYL
jgi:hypothetical protein